MRLHVHKALLKVVTELQYLNTATKLVKEMLNDAAYPSGSVNFLPFLSVNFNNFLIVSHRQKNLQGLNLLD